MFDNWENELNGKVKNNYVWSLISINFEKSMKLIFCIVYTFYECLVQISGSN